MAAGDRERLSAFCRNYLRCMDPELAASNAGYPDGFALLETRNVQKRMEQMRAATADQIRREDVIRRLAQLAFGRANDAMELALRRGEEPLENLDLSAVAELKVTDKGGVEIKFIDRIRVLETLCGLLGGESGHGATELCRVLAEAAGNGGGWEDG